MPAIKKLSMNQKHYYGNGVVNTKVRDHGNDPLVVKKTQDAKAFLFENGLNGLPDSKK